MKKVIKVIAGLALTSAMCAGAFALSSCANSVKSYNGEYHYPNAWAPTAPHYGIKVRVNVQSDKKGDRIKSVEIVDSTYTEVSDGWTDKDLWLNNVDNLLLSYRGKYVADVLAQTAETSSGGQPESVSDDSLNITGATQGSGRLLLAVQNALMDAAENLGYTVFTGEYHYPNAWAPTAPHYGIKVKVVVKNSKIAKVAVAPSGYVSVTDTWEAKQVWFDGIDGLLAAYEGRKVEDILKVNVVCNAGGQPDSVADSSLMISGATQGSGRLLLAVQDALRHDDTVAVTYEGEYHYPNAWAPTAPHYGIKVKVSVRGTKVERVTVADSDYVSVTDSWEDKAIWNDGLNALLDKYSGMNVAELLALDVTCSEGGQPDNKQELGGLLITGATQGSGRLLLAVQNALSKIEGYEVVSGEYHYANPWGGADYGIKVKVVVNDDKIACVRESAHAYTSVTDSWQDKQVWMDGLDGLLKKYEDKSVAEILTLNVAVNSETVSTGSYFSAVAGQPDNGQELGGLLITGATQGSGRLLLAVQDALAKLDGYEVVEGEYHYPNAWAPTAPHYGIKVQVIVKDGKVVAVKEINHDYVSVTDSWGDKQLWFDGLDGLLAKYAGKSVTELLTMNVSCNEGGQPNNEQELGGLLITGATQGSGRLLLAVQDALAKLDGYEVLEGEYHYANAWGGADYGIKVKVVVSEGKVLAVNEASHAYTSVTSSWTDKQTWMDGLDELLAKYAGKSVAEILALDVSCNEGGQPDNGQELGGLLITGATQGSGRLLLAVQDALAKLDGYEVLEGEYHYANAWGGADYGIKVKVVVSEGKVLAVNEASHAYTSVTSSWTDKQTWIDGLDELLAKYAGKSVAEILALDVSCNEGGQPNNEQELGGLLITGATQGSGRLLLAVQDALSKLDGYEVLEGEYHYANAWGGADYGIKVKVVVSEGKVLAANEASHAYTSVTSSWTDKQTWIDGLDELLAKYAGKSVAEILALDVSCNEGGQPDNGQELGGLLITGATQGSGRLLLAVKDALTKSASYSDYKIVSGEYHYANAWAPTAPHYGIKVNVVVKDGKIECVREAAHEYVSVTDSWEDKQLWFDGIDELLKGYEGKTVAEVLALTVDCNEGGQPNNEQELGGLLITGATQGSGRLLLAVQDALKSL